jgi:hypothetical protein
MTTLAAIAATHGRDLAYLTNTEPVTADNAADALHDAITTLESHGYDADLLLEALNLITQAADPAHQHTGNAHTLLDRADGILRRELGELRAEFETDCR